VGERIEKDVPAKSRVFGTGFDGSGGAERGGDDRGCDCGSIEAPLNEADFEAALTNYHTFRVPEFSPGLEETRGEVRLNKWCPV
jgi:hypothetical protein